jgi:aromatic ring-opening dioxygenase catalytic subunit (LigB family)
MTTPSLPTLFISHGGGPWPWMRDEMAGRYDRLAAALQQVPALVGTTPEAILMVSAHWEERDFTLMSHSRPPMIYDYSGFPEYTYRIRYDAPGAPRLAEQVREFLADAGIPAKLDPERGFDHGMYAPMAVMYPEADVPVSQLSLKRGLDPNEHLAAGRALARLRDAGVLIVGSGLSYHNLRMFGPAAKVPSAQFDEWLDRTLAANADDRESALAHWAAAPAARVAHPREEHLLPLMIAAGAAGRDAASRIYHEDDFFGGISVSNFMFGGTAPHRGA